MIRFLIACFCIFLWLGKETKAQNFTKNIGIKVGLASNWLAPVPEEVVSRGNLLGYQVGIFGRITTPITNFYFQPELYYAQKGGRYTLLGAVEKEARINTIDLGAHLGKRLFMGYGRVQIGVIFSSVASQELMTKTPISTFTTPIENLNGFMMGMQIGIGADLKKFTFDIRYESILTNLVSVDNYFKPRGLQFSVGFKIL
ncbi:MAG: PorT family protein [Cytophagales bacterium]|nr:MAG: PorT family protein [Cytophagales bacterium]